MKIYKEINEKLKIYEKWKTIERFKERISYYFLQILTKSQLRN